MKDVFDSSRLDYPDTLFKVDGDYAYIDFATEEINKAGIPYSPDFGGREVSVWPFTGSGLMSPCAARTRPHHRVRSRSMHRFSWRRTIAASTPRVWVSLVV